MRWSPRGELQRELFSSSEREDGPDSERPRSSWSMRLRKQWALPGTQALEIIADAGQLRDAAGKVTPSRENGAKRGRVVTPEPDLSL
jgi:hypothetical protein